MDDKLGAPCPRCERTGPVWKVSDFFGFNRDRSHAEYHPPVGFVGALAANRGRPLEKRLQPPAKPHWRGYGGLLAIVLIALYRALLFGFLFAFVATWLRSVLGLSREPSFFEVAAVSFCLLYIPLILWMRRVERRHDLEFPRWQRAFARWGALYYCARCDLVFLPGPATRLMSPEEMPAYLAEAATSAKTAP